jgi:hypothetical protein
MDRIEAAEYLLSLIGDDDRIQGIDQSHILSNGVDGRISEAIKILNLALTANGALYRRDQIGVIPSIIVDYYAERKEVKKEMLSVENEIEEIKTEMERRRLQKKEQADAEYKGDRKRYKI